VSVSLSKAAGDRLNAADVMALANELNSLTRPQIASSTSPSAAIGTSPTAVLTISGCVLRAGCAYSVENVGGVYGSVANEADFSLWKTSTAGTQIGAFYRTPANTVGIQRSCNSRIFIRNSTGGDLTFDMVLSVAASTGTVVHYAAASFPRMLIVKYEGLASEWPGTNQVT